jgi:hypothetical protein
MSSLRKKDKHIRSKIEYKEEQRSFLRSKQDSYRCSSLSITSDSSQMSEEEQLVCLADILFDFFLEQTNGSTEK